MFICLGENTQQMYLLESYFSAHTVLYFVLFLKMYQQRFRVKNIQTSSLVIFSCMIQFLSAFEDSFFTYLVKYTRKPKLFFVVS